MSAFQIDQFKSRSRAGKQSDHTMHILEHKRSLKNQRCTPRSKLHHNFFVTKAKSEEEINQLLEHLDKTRASARRPQPKPSCMFLATARSPQAGYLSPPVGTYNVCYAAIDKNVSAPKLKPRDTPRGLRKPPSCENSLKLSSRTVRPSEVLGVKSANSLAKTKLFIRSRGDPRPRVSGFSPCSSLVFQPLN